MKVQIAFTLLLIALSINVASADRFAVLVAGSNGWYNYRHQADVCHGYLSLLDKGIPAANIIVMSYNDVASDSSNPFPNTLFNAPSKSTGWDVNKGCVIDYQGSDVTSANYLNILLGNTTALKGVGTGRVLKSTSKDEVFLSFYDHGGSGLIGFPSDYLYANDFQNTLKKMHTNKQFAKLVYYMEACESGSMWQGFPTNLSIYSLSAANATESSWATYCPASYGMNDGGSIVNGTDLGVCLGDLFSVNWMENLDQANTLEETLKQQYTIVEKETNLSHVLQWGETSLDTAFISDYFGTTNSKFRPGAPTQKQQDQKISSSINARLVELNYYKSQYEKDPTNQAKKQQYEKVVAENNYFTNTFNSILKSGYILPAEGPLVIQNYDCLKNLVSNFEASCRKFSDFGLQYVNVLAQLCENSVLEGDAAKVNLVTTSCNSSSSQQSIVSI